MKKQMNKRLRQVMTQLKFKKRLRQLGLLGKEGKYYCYKSTGKPCSCPLCSPEKYNRKIKHKKKIIESIEE